MVLHEGGMKGALSTNASEVLSELPALPVRENRRFRAFCFGDDLQEDYKLPIPI